MIPELIFATSGIVFSIATLPVLFDNWGIKLPKWLRWIDGGIQTTGYVTGFFLLLLSYAVFATTNFPAALPTVVNGLMWLLVAVGATLSVKTKRKLLAKLK